MLKRPRRLPEHQFVPDLEQNGQGSASRTEMRAFDQLGESARRSIAASKFGVQVADTINDIHRRGVCDAVKAALKAKGLTVYAAGVDGVLLEEIAIMERDESRRIQAEVEGRVAPRSTNAATAQFGFYPTGPWR